MSWDRDRLGETIMLCLAGMRKSPLRAAGVIKSLEGLFGVSEADRSSFAKDVLDALNHVTESGFVRSEITSDAKWKDHALGRYREVKWTQKVLRDVLSLSGCGFIAVIGASTEHDEHELMKRTTEVFGVHGTLAPSRSSAMHW